MKLLTKLQKNRDFWFLLITSFIFFLLRLPSLFEPYWYGDEGIYEVIGYALRHGRLLYSGIWDNKPPLLYLVYAVFDGNQTGAKFLSLLAGLGAVWGVFFLSKKLFTNKKAVFTTTGLFAFLFGIPLIEGNIANAENFMLVLGIVSGLLIYSNNQTHTKYKIQNTKYLVAGLLLGLSFLFKVVGMFDMAAFVVFLAIVGLEKINSQTIIQTIKKLIPFFTGFIIPIVLCALFFVMTRTFSTFIHSVLFSNVSYVNYGNQFNLPAGRQVIPQGFLILKTLLLVAVVVFLFIKRTNIHPTKLFIFLWLTFSLYSALFSQRPYTHYVLVFLPSFILLIGLLINETKQKIFYGVVTGILFLFVGTTFSYNGKTIPYYENFIQFVTDGETPTAYRAFFDQVTPRDYQIAQFITMQQKEHASVFIWGNSGQIYKLANTLPPGRFIVAYHITMTPQNYKETSELLAKNPPQFLITLPKQDLPPISLSHYKELFIMQNATVYEHIL